MKKRPISRKLLIASLGAMLLGGCAAPSSQPQHGVTVTAKIKGESRPTTYVITANQVTATRHNHDGSVSTGTGRNMQEAMANMKNH